jgi:hypothetical protein
MFQDQQEIPGQRQLFERLKSVERDFEAITLAEPFPTETLVPQLVREALEELVPNRRRFKRPDFLAVIMVAWGLVQIVLTYNSSRNMALEILFGSFFILGGIVSFFGGVTLTKRTRLIVAILNNRHDLRLRV